MAKITDHEALIQRVIEMLPKSVPTSAIERVEFDSENSVGAEGEKEIRGSYWVYLNSGWTIPETGCSSIHEDTLADLGREIKKIEKYEAAKTEEEPDTDWDLLLGEELDKSFNFNYVD